MANQTLPSDRPVRLAVIGLGGASQLIHLPILDAMDDVELVGLSDVEEYKLSRMCEKYDVPGFVDASNLLERVRPDAVFICTPTITHLPLALTALDAGAHVIIEKPAARNRQEVERLMEAQEKADRQVFVAMNLRFRQDAAVLHNLLKSGDLGSIWRVRAGWLKRYGHWHRSSWMDQQKISGGGVLMDLGIQLLDGVLWLLDKPRITRVVAHMHHENLGKEVEDTLSVSLDLEDGPVVHVDCSWGVMAEQDQEYTVFEGSEGTAKANPLVIYRVMQGELVSVTPVKSARPRDLYQASFEAQWHHFGAALRGEASPISTLEEARDLMELVEWIYTSAKEGHEIRPDQS